MLRKLRNRRAPGTAVSVRRPPSGGGPADLAQPPEDSAQDVDQLLDLLLLDDQRRAETYAPEYDFVYVPKAAAQHHDPQAAQQR
ncbi:MAG TPA: hypothetical protein VK454_00980 [Myxococcaceae bacterium]|nr:hypothetical protein [Myxococcaceae bacterium]